MPGQCYGCGAEFGVFKKEHGCKNCGFAFCNKCLNEKSIPVPKKNNSKHHVCHKCYKILTGAAAPPPDPDQARYDLPEAYLKRVAALKEREEEGHSSHSSNTSNLKGGQKIPEHLRRLDKADRDIAMRLEKLKEDRKPKENVSETELNARLAQLKGQTHTSEKKPVYQPPDRRPQTQQVDDLIDQLTAEVNIDSLRLDPAKDVEARLAHLRQTDVPASEATTKPVVDNNNLNVVDKGETDRNDLNKVDKMGSMGQPLSPGAQNIGVGKTDSSATGGSDIDMAEMQRLMAEAAKELELDAQRAIEGMQKDKELMERLREIQKRKDEKKISNDSEATDSETDNTAQKLSDTAADNSDDDEENEDAAAKRIIQRYLDEVKIDKAFGDSNASPQQAHSSAAEKSEKKEKKKDTGSSAEASEVKPSKTKSSSKKELADSDYDDSDELPYCCICTEDATIRCRDCDLDLYCQRCFKECHSEMGITDHRTTPYKPPKGYR